MLTMQASSGGNAVVAVLITLRTETVVRWGCRVQLGLPGDLQRGGDVIQQGAAYFP